MNPDTHGKQQNYVSSNELKLEDMTDIEIFEKFSEVIQMKSSPHILHSEPSS